MLHARSRSLPALSHTQFTAQSQLNLFAATGLDAVSFQVTNQLKILPTAFFSALYLRRRLSTRQWVSLPALALGVAIVNSATDTLDTHGAARFAREWWAGLLAAIIAAVLSGYAGVYCERLLKTGTAGGGAVAAAACARVGAPQRCVATAAGAQSARAAHARCAECAERGGGADGAACACAACARAAPRTPRVSAGLLLVRPVPRVPLLALNIQLSLWGAALAGAQVAALHAGSRARPGPLHGFGGYAWGVVALQALGGLLVSVVITYADNIIKSFAMAISILLSWLLSIPLFGLHPTPLFVVGLALVLASVLLFSAAPPQQSAQQSAPAVARPRRSSTADTDAGCVCLRACLLALHAEPPFAQARLGAAGRGQRCAGGAADGRRRRPRCGRAVALRARGRRWLDARGAHARRGCLTAAWPRGHAQRTLCARVNLCAFGLHSLLVAPRLSCTRIHAWSALRDGE
jgi:UDP-sugar transporter A1/2/3